MTNKITARKNKSPERLHERIRRLRLEQNYRLNIMAEILGVSPSFLAQAEAGQKRLADKKLRKFAKIVGVDQEDLLDVDIKVPTEALQKKVDADPYFMKLLWLLLRTRRPTQRIIQYVNKDIRENEVQERMSKARQK